MNKRNQQRAKLALAELEKELEILSIEEINSCKGGWYNVDAWGIADAGVTGTSIITTFVLGSNPSRMRLLSV